MSQPAPPQDPGSPRPRGVMIARGTGGADLRSVAEALDSAAVNYEVEEQLQPDGSEQTWQIFVRARDVLQARRALQQLVNAGPRDVGATSTGPPTGPLFEGGGRGLTRSLLMFACFGLGAALLVRGCTG